MKSIKLQSLEATPSWSFRYAELMGSIVIPDVVEHVHGAQKALAKNVPKAAPVDSVFLAKNGRDKRLPKEEVMMGRTKPSRWTARRDAISGVGQSKLQVRTAVKIQTLRYPDQMRRLHMECETVTGTGNVLVAVKHLEMSQLGELMHSSGLPEAELHNLFSAFTRYDIDDSCYLDRAEVRQVLSDLGLQPRGAEEKLEVNEIICDADSEGLRHYNFDEFVTVVKTVRERLRQIQHGECIIIFEDADQDGNHSLSMDEVLWLLDKRLNMMPRTAEERHEVLTIFQACDDDGDGQLFFEQFQDFVQRARAKLIMMRREEELNISKAFSLPQESVAEFRIDLPQLWAIFTRYDRTGQSTVLRADLVGLLMDVGLYPVKQQTHEKKISFDSILDSYAFVRIDFPSFLNLIHELRVKFKTSVQEELQERFHCYDKHKRGELHYNEVYRILADFKMLPKSREEQQSIVSVIERLDVDGSGTFDFEEFQDFFQRLTEQVRMNEREAERQMILAMGFTECHLHALRSVFLSLNPNQDRKIAQLGLVSAVHRIRDVLCPNGADDQHVREITRKAQSAPDRSISFQEFAQSLRVVMAKKEDDIADEG